MRLLVLSFCLFAVTACDEKLTGPTAAVNSEFTLAPGESVGIEGFQGNLAIVGPFGSKDQVDGALAVYAAHHWRTGEGFAFSVCRAGR